MKRNNQPIINSMLDLDLYKLTMAQLVYALHGGVVVKYAFRNRTKKVRLADCIDLGELREQLDHARSLEFTNQEISYLASLKVDGKEIFSCSEFLWFLSEFKLPPYELEARGGDLFITVEDRWRKGIFWETIILSIVNELYYHSVVNTMEKAVAVFKGTRKLAKKIRILRDNPDIKFIEFGTRRRFSNLWQRVVTESLADILPSSQFLGTSNVKLAMDLNIQPVGTMAHELFMVYQGIYHGSDEEIRGSHNRVLVDWYNYYGSSLSVALTDTCGSDFFFRDMTEEQARQWKGLRQDSGDPLVFGEKAIRFYESYDIDPREKVLVFSDGLDIETILKIQSRFRGRTRVSFGWGTNLTNDLGLEPLSLVVKAVEANSRRLVKLSDNLNKATGDPEDIERFKGIFGYTGKESAECRY